MSRTYTSIATVKAKKQLDDLLKNTSVPTAYQSTMRELGRLLGEAVVPHIKHANTANTMVVSTAEDADFLQEGVSTALKFNDIHVKLAVFWNHHYQLPSNTSVAPILHSFIEPNYENVNNIVIVKSVMSGSCVVRTNLIELLGKIKNIDNIYVLSPIAHKNSEERLRKSFPKEISSKFNFLFFAIDDEKNQDGEVIPGIGGQIYDLLGIGHQPALNGYIPNVVRARAFSGL